MKANVELVIAGVLIVLGLVFITNPNLISWFPSIIHYIIGILGIVGGLYFGMKGLK